MVVGHAGNDCSWPTGRFFKNSSHGKKSQSNAFLPAIQSGRDTLRLKSNARMKSQQTLSAGLQQPTLRYDSFVRWLSRVIAFGQCNSMHPEYRGLLASQLKS